MIGAKQRWILTGSGLAGECELRVIVRELAVVQLRLECDGSFGIFGNANEVVGHIGGARRNQAHVEDTAGLPGITLIDLIAGGIELVRLVEMRAWFNGTMAVVLNLATPENYASV